jgi:small subunit ribosomal protein S8
MSLQSTDPIADLLTRIRNAIMVGKTEVRVPTSKQKLVIAKQLVKNKYIDNVVEEKNKPRNELVITINSTNSNARITEIKRVSKPGRRVYVGSNDIPKVKSGRGIVLISTSKGVMNDHEARKARLGGELLLTVY